MPDRQLPSEIRKFLRRLRHRIRGYVVTEGLALALVLLGVAFWLSLGLDVGYFRLSRLEVPRWFRSAFDVITLALFTAVLIERIGLRALRPMRFRDLALLLEHRFPELQDRLITAVELSRSQPDSPVTRAMLQRTVADVTRVLPQLELPAVFARQRLRRVVLAACMLAVSIATFAWANPDSIRRWKAAYLSLEHEYWSRQFRLRLKVLAQPGDRIRPFVDQGDAFQYKHARGEPLTVIVEADRGSRAPDLVELRYRLVRSQSRGRVFCSRLDEGRFKHAFGDLFEDLDLWVTGGDYTNRKPYRVVLVEPPRVDRVWLDCTYPDYMGREIAHPVRDADGVPRDRIALLGRQVSLPVETAFLLRAECNKPLVGLRVEFPPYELIVRLRPTANPSADAGTDPDQTSPPPSPTVQAVLQEFDEDGRLRRTRPLPSPVAARFFIADRRGFCLPMVLSRAASEPARRRIEQLTTPYGSPLLMPPDTTIRIWLEDTDGIIGSEPARFTLNGVPDEPPVVETQLRGIGTSITRKAVIPVTGTVRDDYGLTHVGFQYTVHQGQAWGDHPLEKPPVSGVREFRIGAHPDGTAGVEKFPVAPLDLSVGQKLTLTVVAKDGDSLNGPHTSHGEKYAFRIVSTEELLSILYQRELNLRQRFEQVLTEMKQIRDALQRDAARLPASADRSASRHDASGDESSPTVSTDTAHASEATGATDVRSAVGTSTDRALQTVRKDANESAEIELAFRDIRDEVVNNAVQTSQMLERLDDRIIAPLERINSDLYPAVDQSLGLLRLAVENNRPLHEPLDQSLRHLTDLIARMEQVLSEMHKLETFQEVLETLKAIIRQQRELAEKTKAQHKKQLIEKLKGLGLEPE